MSKQNGVKDVFNCMILDYATKKPFLNVDYAKTTEQTQSADRAEWRGGQGNALLLARDHTKKVSGKITLPLLDQQIFAMLNGTEVVTGAEKHFHREVLVVDSSNQVTLTKTPTGSLFLFDKDGRDFGKEIKPKAGLTVLDHEYELDSGNVYTLNATSHPEGTFVIATYQYATPDTTTTVTVPVDKFPKFYTISADELWIDPSDNLEYAVKNLMYKVQPKSNYTLKYDGTAAQLEFEYDLLAEVADVVDGKEVYAYSKQSKIGVAQ